MPETVNPEHAVIVGGGAIGTMFAGMMVGSGLYVVSVDRADPSAERELTGVTYMMGDIEVPDESIEKELACADMVMLALPEQVIRSSLGYVASEMRTGSLLVETSSVKSRVTTDMRALPGRIEAMGLNPMFSPSAGASGRPVAVVTTRDGQFGRGLVRLLTEWEMVPVPVEAEYHDRITAATQVATHVAVLTLGLTLIDLGVDIDDLSKLATPPHMALLALMGRIVSAAPEVYWDIQAANPRAPLARQLFSKNISELDALMAREEEDGFVESLDKIRRFLGSHTSDLDDVCVRIYSQMQALTGDKNSGR